MYARLARAVDRRAALVVVVWLLAAVWITLTAPSVRELGTADQTAFVPASAPSGRADALLRKAFPDDPSRDPAVLVLARPGGLQPRDRAYVASLATFMASPAASTYVKAVQTATTAPELAPVLRSPDGEAELVIVSLHTQVFTAGADEAVAFLREHLAGTAPPGLSHEVTGLAALASDQAKATLEAFDRTALATVVLVLLILVLVYRSALAPLISLLSIGCAFLVARGLAGYLAEAGVQIASLADTFMVVMAFGAGTDYVMFVISRYREFQADPAGRRHGLQRATTMVGPTIVASGATVTIGFLAFLTAELGLFRSFGPVLGLAVAVTVVAGLTLTPAMLRLAGRGAFWPSRRTPAEAAVAGRARWERLAAFVGRRPAAVLIATVALLAVPAWGATSVRQSFDMPAELPASAGARQGFETLSQHYPPGVLAPVALVLSNDTSLLDNERLHAVDRLTDTLRDMPGVAEVRSITQPAGGPLTTATLARFTGGTTDFKSLGIDPDRVDVTPLVTALASEQGLRIDATILAAYPPLRERLGYFLDAGAHTTRITVAFEASPYARTALDLVRGLDDLAAAGLAGGPLAGAQVAVAGPSAYFADIEDLAAQDVRTVGAIVVGAILLILALLLRSVVAPLYLMASVLLSLLAAMGLTAWFFQGVLGHAGLAFWLTPFLFVMLVALGADYNIFIAARIREEIDDGRSVKAATQAALVGTGPTITSAGFVLAGTFGALLITPIPSVRQIGFGVCAGILIDTFIVRTLLVPAATILLGEYAFWPSTSPARQKGRRRVAVAVSGAGVVALSATLIAVGLGDQHGSSVVEVAGTRDDATPTLASASGQRTLPTPTPTTLVTGRTRAAPGGAARPKPLTRPRAETPGPQAAPGRAPGALPAAAKSPADQAGTGRATAAAGTGKSSGPVAVPAQGAWRYEVEGTRTIGLAGSSQPFHEATTAEVSRVGGTDTAPEMLVRTQSSFATTEETRRYSATAVDLLSLRASSAGLGYGGTFTSPQLLLRNPIRVGDTWTGNWRTEGTEGTTSAKVTGTRTVTLAGRDVRCYVVVRHTTLSGDITGTQEQRSCWIPHLGMPAEDEQQLHGTYEGVGFDANARMTLRSTPTETPAPGRAEPSVIAPAPTPQERGSGPVNGQYEVPGATDRRGEIVGPPVRAFIARPPGPHM